MLEAVRNKLKAIEQISLEDESYNEEWLQLLVMQNSLIKLTKIVKERNV